MNQEMNNGRTVSTILSDTKEELKEFLETRIAMLKAELGEKMGIVKAAAPLAAVGIVFLGTAWLLFTLGLVGLIIAQFPGNPYRWAIGFFAIAILWAVIGAITAFSAKRAFALKKLLPNRTMQVLKEDKTWAQSEVRSRL